MLLHPYPSCRQPEKVGRGGVLNDNAARAVAPPTPAHSNPKTGRTHQIRIHLKSIGHPIICDKLYAPKRECLLGFKRLALHARELRVKNVSNETLILEAPFPDDFEDALREIAS